MAIFAVTYEYTDDTEGRDLHRPSHKDFLGGLGDRGVNLCSGPFGPGETPGALILISATSKEEALRHTEGDPFRTNGLVRRVTVQEWIPMMGPLAPKLV